MKKKELKEKKMEFDKSRCYSAISADVLKPGDKVIVANDLKNLKRKVLEGFNHYIMSITSILGEEYSNRFCIEDDHFPLVYLVERKENCTNCDMCERTNSSDDEEYECSPYGYIGDKERAKVHKCSDWTLKAEPKAEKQYRPFKDTDELTQVWASRCSGGKGYVLNSLDMPLVWIRRKYDPSAKGVLITAYADNCVELGEAGTGAVLTMNNLLNQFEFLDGSPCGVEE